MAAVGARVGAPASGFWQLVEGRWRAVDDEHRALSVAHRYLRLARDLVAKRAVERHLRRRAARSFAPDFEVLPCCAERSELHGQLEEVERQIRRQEREEANVVLARKEEVAQLGAEVAQLRRRAQRCGLSVLPGALGAGLPDAGFWTIQAELEGLEQQKLQAQREAKEDAAALELERAKAAKELRRLQERLLAVAPPAAGLPMAPPEPAVPLRSPDIAAPEGESPAQPAGMRGLAQRCVELHAVMDQLLAILGQPQLPPCPPDDAMEFFDAKDHVPWIAALAAAMSDLNCQLRNPA